MRNADTTFTPDSPAEAVALLADLEVVPERKERRGHDHKLRLQPTPRRTGFFRRAELVPTATLWRRDGGFFLVVSKAIVEIEEGSLSSELAANGFTAPARWRLGADISTNAGWEIPGDEHPEEIVRALISALRAMPDGSGLADTYDAELEHSRPSSNYTYS